MRPLSFSHSRVFGLSTDGGARQHRSRELEALFDLLRTMAITRVVCFQSGSRVEIYKLSSRTIGYTSVLFYLSYINYFYLHRRFVACNRFFTQAKELSLFSLPAYYSTDCRKTLQLARYETMEIAVRKSTICGRNPGYIQVVLIITHIF